MKEITFTPQINAVLNLGYQFDHKARTITFGGFRHDPKNVVYLRIECEDKYMIPLADDKFEVTHPYTLKAGSYPAKLVEIGENNKLISSSPPFTALVKPSLDNDGKYEIHDPNLDLWTVKVKGLYDEITEKLEAGELKGKDGKPFEYEDFTPEQLESLKGKDGYTPQKNIDYFDGKDGKTPVKGTDYFTQEEKEEFASQISTGAIGSFDEHYEEKVIDFNYNAEQRKDAYNSNASSKLAEFNEHSSAKIKEYDTNATNAKKALNDYADSQKESAAQTIDQKVTEASQAIDKKKQEAIDALPEIASLNEDIAKLKEEDSKLSESIHNASQKIYDAQTIIENHIKATPDYGTYTVRFPKWETSHTANGEKLDDNQGLVLTPATDKIKEVNTYPHCFDTIDVNAYVDEDGVRHITAIKGDNDFKDTGRVDVFVCLRTYWEKYWEEDGYEYYSRCYYPKEGYTINRLAINRDGTYNSWFLIAKYMAGDILDDDSVHTHELYSSKGLRSAHYISSAVGDEEITDSISWSGMQSIFKRRGTFYTGSLASESKHFTTSMWLYFATKNSQSIMHGCENSSFHYICAEPIENMNCFVVTASQASSIDLLQCVSIGDNNLTTAPDRNIGLCHNIAYDARVIKKETLESGNVAIYVDHTPFTTTATSWISSFHEVSGYSDLILGRNGSPISNTNGRHGMVLDGIELMVGGYETLGNVIFNATSDPLIRDMVLTNDATKLSTNVNTFIANAITLPVKSTVEKEASWQYVTEVALDLENGIAINTKAGQEGSGSTTGYCDGQYFDAITSGQREVLSLGGLWRGSYAGLRFVDGRIGVATADWGILARLSVNAVGGELRNEV